MRALTLGIVVAIAAASAVTAQADDVQTAKAHFAEGKRLLKKGNFPEAIKELEAAYALDPKNEQLFNLGVAHHLNKDLKVAADYYRRFLAVETKGKTVEQAKGHLAQIEKLLAVEAAGEQLRADEARKIEEARLAEEQRLKALRDAEDRERIATARVATLEADLARTKLARDTQRSKADAMRGEADAAERRLGRWRASALAAPSGGGRGMRVLSTFLIVGGAGALGAGGWNGLRAQDLEAEVQGASGAWTTDLDRAVEDGQAADDTFQLLAPVGGAAMLLGLITRGFGESWSTDRRDRKALELRIAGPEVKP